MDNDNGSCRIEHVNATVHGEDGRHLISLYFKHDLTQEEVVRLMDVIKIFLPYMAQMARKL